MNLSTDELEYVEYDGKKEISIVRTNLMNEKGYAPYCGANGISRLGRCSNPRTKWNGKQFQCSECGFITAFPLDFIARYKAKWNLTN